MRRLIQVWLVLGLGQATVWALPQQVSHLVAMPLFAGPVSAQAGNTSPAPLPAAAQRALEKGLTAAQGKNWEVAIRYFNEARRAAPDAPQPLFNLGLAEAQTPGRELRAIAWFQAYLALAPEAANAAQVQQEIAELDIRAESNGRKLIDILKALAQQSSTDQRPYAMEDIARLSAKIGDINDVKAALQAIESIPSAGQGAYARPRAYQHISAVLASRGRSVEALELAGKIPSDDYSIYSDVAHALVASALIKAGSLSEAKLSLSLMKKPLVRYQDEPWAVLELVEAELAAGAGEDALAVLREIRARQPDAIQNVQFVAAEFRAGQREHLDATIRGCKPEKDSVWAKWAWEMHCLAQVDYLVLGQRQEAWRKMREANKADFYEFERVPILNLPLGWGPSNLISYSLSVDDYDGAHEIFSTILSRNKKSEWFSPDNRAYWEEEIEVQRIRHVGSSAKALAIKIFKEGSASAPERAQAWVDWLTAALDSPLFHDDFKSTLDGVSHYVPPQDIADKTKPIFHHVLLPAEELLDCLQDVRDLQAAAGRKAGARTEAPVHQ